MMDAPFHDDSPVYFQKEGFQPRLATTPAEKVNLEADGWRIDDRPRGSSGATAKRAKRNTQQPTGRKSTGATKTTTPGVEVSTE